MDFIPHTKEETQEMLGVIGVQSLDELFKNIPKEIPQAALKLPKALSEQELLSELKELGSQNTTVSNADSYLGAGSYEHFIPSVVSSLVNRSEFVTAYTPYQAEASQGTLQTIYEYQTLICQLTGMDVSNASLYEGGSALAEAVLVTWRNKNTINSKVLISKTVHPEYRHVVKTYCKGLNIEIIEVPYKDGISDIEFIKDKIDKDTLAVVVQSPNFFGCLEPLGDIVPIAKKQNALGILSTNPISLGVLRDPGELGFDIVVGEGQPLGNPLSFGGPYLGFLACTKALMRKIPGRLVGRTKDTQGRTGYVLTLQTREQHIRREKATSNICTNEALNALAACIYLCTMGKSGIEELAKQNVYLSHYAKDELCNKTTAKMVFNQPFFNEFLLDVSFSKEKLLNSGIISGLDIGRFYPELSGKSLWCTTETKTRVKIDKLVEAINENSSC